MKYVLKDSLNCVANKKDRRIVGKLIQPPKWKNRKIALILNSISPCKQTVKYAMRAVE